MNSMILDIYESDLRTLKPEASALLIATMHAPTDPTLRKQLLWWFLSGELEDAGYLSEAVTWEECNTDLESAIDEAIHKGIFEHVRLLLTFRKFCQTHSLKTARRGEITGQVLKIACAIERERPGQASLGKALWILTGPQKGNAIGAGSKTLKRHWRAYRSASHLWASAITLKLQASDFDDTDRMDVFLVLAEIYRVMGEHIVPPYQGETLDPLLRPGQAWELPVGSIHRRCAAKMSFEPPRLPAFMNERLDKYRYDEARC